MPDRKIWLAGSSVLIYHLDRNCRALKNANDVLQSEDADLDKDGKSSNSNMRLCGFCESKSKRWANLDPRIIVQYFKK